MALFLAPVVVAAQVYVRPHVRRDGTYVPGHYRSRPDGNPYNIFSYPGNVNPYTGRVAPGNSDSYLRQYERNRGGGRWDRWD